MNRLIIELIMAGCLLASGAILYYVISENGKLENENESLTASIKDHETAISDLGQVVSDLSIKYSEATNNEFKKFNKTDIDQIPMSELVQSFYIGTDRVLKDYKYKTTEFIKGNTKTTIP